MILQLKSCISMAIICLSLQFNCQGQVYSADILREAGYSLDVDSLVIALQDKRIGVRSSAASMLGQESDSRILPALEIAIDKESNTNVLFSMLVSADKLGLSVAKSKLTGLCSAKQLDLQARAAGYLISQGDLSCLQVTIALASSTDEGLREAGLLQLQSVKGPPPQAAAEIGLAMLAIVEHSHSEYNSNLAAKIILQASDERTKKAYKQFVDNAH